MEAIKIKLVVRNLNNISKLRATIVKIKKITPINVLSELNYIDNGRSLLL